MKKCDNCQNEFGIGKLITSGMHGMYLCGTCYMATPLPTPWKTKSPKGHL